jgi:hypothetical protein
VTASPGTVADGGDSGPITVTVTGTSGPVTISGLASTTDYTFSVVAHGAVGDSPAVTTGVLGFFEVVETFDEPGTRPNNTIFTGTFTFDYTAKTMSNLSGSLTESMVGPPMSTVALDYQLSSVPFSVAADAGGGTGLLVATFALNTTNVFTGGGFAPGGTDYYGEKEGTANNNNAYALIFVNTTEPSKALTQAEINELAYADCTSGGMMGTRCMTGTTTAGYGTTGTMGGYPVSEVITQR